MDAWVHGRRQRQGQRQRQRQDRDIDKTGGVDGLIVFWGKGVLDWSRKINPVFLDWFGWIDLDWSNFWIDPKHGLFFLDQSKTIHPNQSKNHGLFFLDQSKTLFPQRTINPSTLGSLMIPNPPARGAQRQCKKYIPPPLDHNRSKWCIGNPQGLAGLPMHHFPVVVVTLRSQ